MPICGHCGREAQPNDRYCQACGAPLGAQNGHADAAPIATATAFGRIVLRSLPGETTASTEDEREFILDGHDISIGRAPSCDIVLEGDQLASRRHALLRFQNGHYTIVDLGSSNGTYVNDLEIREATPLRDNDHITVGGHELTFSTEAASPHASFAGQRPSGQPLAAPLNETNPQVSVVNIAAPYAPSTGESGALPEPLEMENADAAAEAQALAEDHAQSNAEAPAEAQEAPASATDESPQPQAETTEESSATTAPDETENAAHPLGEHVPEESTEASEPVNSFIVATVAPASGAPTAATSTEAINSAISTGWLTGDLEELRSQLNDISATLSQRVNEEAQRALNLRNALSEMRSLVVSLLERQSATPQPQPAPQPPNDVSDLVTIARQAAEHPRHLDYLTSLAEHAGKIADALEATQQTEPTQQTENDDEVRSGLEGLRTLLDQLLS